MNVFDYIKFKSMGLSSDEIKACIKSGVSPDEIAALNSADNDAATSVNKAAGADAKADAPVVPEVKPDVKPEVKAEKKEPEKDYKALYEAEHAKVTKLQADKTKQPVDDKPLTIDEIAEQIASKFF